MTEKFSKNINSLYLFEQISKKVEKLKITEDEFIYLINDGLVVIKDKFLQREHAKSLLCKKNLLTFEINFITFKIFRPIMGREKIEQIQVLQILLINPKECFCNKQKWLSLPILTQN